MKVLAVSDQVQELIYSPAIRSRFGDVELVLSCGDLGFYYLEFIVSMLCNAPLLYVRGNHDDKPFYTSSGRVITRAEGCLDIDGQVVYEAGMLVAGIEGSMRYRPNAKHMYNDRQIYTKLLRMTPRFIWNKARHGRYLDILVTHAPPYGIHDRSDLAHTGFRAFLPFMRIFRPRYLLHGHVHVYNPLTVTQTRYEDTFVINVYPFQVMDIPLVGNRPDGKGETDS